MSLEILKPWRLLSCSTTVLKVVGARRLIRAPRPMFFPRLAASGTPRWTGRGVFDVFDGCQAAQVQSCAFPLLCRRDRPVPETGVGRIEDVRRGRPAPAHRRSESWIVHGLAIAAFPFFASPHTRS